MILGDRNKYTYLFFIVVLGNGTLLHLQKFLQYIKYYLLRYKLNNE
jgi:hypothetical protein